ncbi:M23 family metallopeptidase [Sphingomonas sp. HDW15A]|uniref:M23 family metallopeptidase n=1 Tax=Sphingomonas sp. HDW15A TaxID=2714942 RepID=UPI00140D61BC|nr:M23 family metallopeptidase [Sphingomonas sp. HDW15A]QIK95395.1 M23 family metallopeptidase [Sphingomonas sp. HDW15A]
MFHLVFASAVAAAAPAAPAAATPAKPRTFIMPPKAVEPSGPIRQVSLSPIFASDFVCSEHFAGQIPFAGDDLGSDCMVTGGVSDSFGFSKLYKSDGRTNEDWYSWGAEVRAPTEGTIAGVVANDGVNRPGTMGKPPAGMLQIRRSDGIIVVLAHVADVRVKLGDPVKAGQLLGVVGNNGMARNPHVHVGAWREANAEPLQIRWDLRAAAALRQEQ